MIRILDLHGLTEAEATGKIINFLHTFIDEGDASCEIITGNGMVLKRAAQDLIEQEGLRWEYNGQNHGSLIVKR